MIETDGSPDDANLFLDEILIKTEERFANMSTKHFDKDIKRPFIRKLASKYQNINIKSNLAWFQIYEDILEFDMFEVANKQLGIISPKKLQKYMKIRNRKRPRKLSIRVYPHEYENKSKKLIEENYGKLNPSLMSYIYYVVDFLELAKIIN